jgi:hypothetical protein
MRGSTEAKVGKENSAIPAEQQPDSAARSANPLRALEYGYQQRFIDEYLKMRVYDLTDDNREIVEEGIARYDGGVIVTPNELVAFLDELFRINEL